MSGTDKMLSMCMAKQLSSFKEPVYKKWKCEVAESSKGVIHVYILHYFKAFFMRAILSCCQEYTLRNKVKQQIIVIQKV